MKLNEDGKFLDRLIPALLAAAIGVGGAALVFWADSKAADRETAAAIQRAERRMDAIESEQRAARLAADNDRQKLSEMAADTRNIVRAVARMESLFDRYVVPQQPR